MLSSRRKTKTRGGSNASARVEQLSVPYGPNRNCGPLRYPDHVKHVMTNSFRNRNLGVSYRIMSGGGKSQSNNWFVSYFLPEIVQHVENGKSPSKIVQEMMKLWNKNHSKEYRITKKVATQMLYDFADANRKHKGGDVVIPLRWVTHKSSKKVKQTGGNPVDNSVNTNESCPVTQSTLPYDYDNYWRPRENSSNASIPRNMFQRTDDWFNGKTTIFTPSHDDITNHSGVKYQCNSSDCSGSTMPKLDNQLVSIRDPSKDIPGSSSFKLFAENQSGNTSPNQYLLPLSRAGSRRRHKSKKRTRK